MENRENRIIVRSRRYDTETREDWKFFEIGRGHYGFLALLERNGILAEYSFTCVTMAPFEKSDAAAESANSVAKNPVEDTRSRLEKVALKSGDPELAKAVNSFMARLETLPEAEKANVAKQMEAILLQAEHDNSKIGPQFFMACEALLSGRLG